MSSIPQRSDKKKSRLWAVLTLRCPRCCEGPLFLNSNPYVLRQLLKMHTECPNCKQDFQIEPGFYYGAAMISWTLQFFLALAVGLIILFMGFRNPWAFIIPIGISLIITTPYVATVSRAIWLSFFIKN